MSRKESKFCVINFIDPQIIFLKKKILTSRAMEMHIQISYNESKLEGRRCMEEL